TSILVISVFCLLNFSCKKEEQRPTLMVNDTSTVASDTVGRGVFVGYQHSLSGSALLYTDINAAKILTMTDFNMTPGPDVYVYLSTTASYSASNVIEVTKLTTGYTNSTLNYTLTGYDPKYKYVLVYCVAFNALFGYAELE